MNVKVQIEENNCTRFLHLLQSTDSWNEAAKELKKRMKGTTDETKAVLDEKDSRRGVKQGWDVYWNYRYGRSASDGVYPISFEQGLKD